MKPDEPEGLPRPATAGSEDADPEIHHGVPDAGERTEGIRLSPYPTTSRSYKGDWKHEMHDLIFLYLDTGACYCEIACLEWSQVDPSGKTIELWRNKTKNRILHLHGGLRSLDSSTPIGEENVPSLGVHELETDRPPATQHGDHERSDSKGGRQSLGSSLRHTFATNTLKEGMTLNDVRLLLGHASIQMTQRYQHLESNDASPKAVAILNRQNVEGSRAEIKAV